MSSIRAFQFASTATLLFATFRVPLLFAQDESRTDTLTFSLGGAPFDGRADSLRNYAVWALRDVFTSRGAVDSHTPDWLFVVAAKPLRQDAPGMIAVSVTTLRGLPKEAIEAGKREEVFYADWPAQKKAALPKEGKWIRELVTEEMLSHYGTPMDQEIIVCERSMVKEELSRFTENFYRRFVYR